MSRWLIAVASIVIIGCSSSTIEDDLYGSGFIIVNEQTWGKNHTTPYPFTMPEGEITCGFHPDFGREVYFVPKGYTNESYIGTPLNKLAVDGLKQSNLTPNVPDNIKKGAKLNDAVQTGLKLCDEQDDTLKNR